MANHTISTSDRALHAVTLAAGVEDVVTFTDRFESRPVVIVHPGTAAPVYVTADGSEATVGGGNCHVVFPGFGLRLRPPETTGPTRVRVVSAEEAVYSVERS